MQLFLADVSLHVNYVFSVICLFLHDPIVLLQVIIDLLYWNLEKDYWDFFFPPFPLSQWRL